MKASKVRIGGDEMRETRFKRTEIGEIPEEWEVIRVGDIFEVYGGTTPLTSNQEYWGGNILWVTPTDMTKLDGKLELGDTEKKITEKAVKEYSLKILPSGTLLLTSRATIGITAINSQPVTINQGITALIPKNDEISSVFYAYYLTFLKRYLERLGAGSTFREVSRLSIRDLKIPLPPLPEQRKIALILSIVDETIQKTNEIIRKTQELKRGLMQRLLTRGIGHTRFKRTELGEIPEEWEVVQLADISVGGTQNGLYKKKEFYGGGYKIVRMTELFKNDVLEVTEMQRVNVTYEELQKYSLREGDLLFARRSLKVEGSGKCVMVPHINEPILFESSIVRITLDKNVVYPKFYLYYLNSPIGRKSIRRLVRTVAVSGVTGKDIQKLFVPKPKLEEQQKIASIFSAIDEKIEKERQKKEELEKLKKGLMQDLLTGSKRVKNAE